LTPLVSATFMICVHDFSRRGVLVKVSVMEFGLNTEVLLIGVVVCLLAANYGSNCSLMWAIT